MSREVIARDPLFCPRSKHRHLTESENKKKRDRTPDTVEGNATSVTLALLFGFCDCAHKQAKEKQYGPEELNIAKKVQTSFRETLTPEIDLPSWTSERESSTRHSINDRPSKKKSVEADQRVTGTDKSVLNPGEALNCPR